MKKNTFIIALILLSTVAHRALAWDGNGTSIDPYLITNYADWKQLADDVRGGNSYSDKCFQMTADIDAGGVSVGSESRPFSGTFSGGTYTLTYNAGTKSSYKEGNNAPFVLLSGATIKDLNVSGIIYSKSMYAAGLACFVDGATATTVSDCHVSIQINGGHHLDNDANFGGFVGQVKGTCSATLSFKNCSFLGIMGNFTTGSACFVGYTPVAVNIEHYVVDPINVYQDPNTATFVRAADGVACTLKECYYTIAYGTE